MKQKRLFLYQVDIKYIRDLSNKDETGNVRSVSPQINKEKDLLWGYRSYVTIKNTAFL